MGIDLWIKRDDLTGFALGGNKGRKLEYLIADALNRHADAIVTCGALQSNFIRQLAAACSAFRVDCVAAVMNLPYDSSVGKKDHNGLGSKGGNALLDELFQADLRVFSDGDWETLYGAAEAAAKELEATGKTVYRIPVGGSSPLGGLAFYQASKELAHQAPPFDFILTSTSSGSTQAGLAYGLAHTLAGLQTNLIGIGADPEPDLIEDVLRVSHGLAELLDRDPLGEADFDVRLNWAGPAYGVPSGAGNQAIERMARREGILLDPIYTGKAFAGLLDLARMGEIAGRVLFWHTGGVPTLFAH